ncbi:hypothetical protein BO94DRAFT_503721 [Aspergillus sclerotioniger CBS 115572]|uniref:Fe2OG dioxygenase domain-containing protein n=1 Tax=Aspergillus sclerotioniger CBS 115572 TaxID=1450535 RepID=A0A317V0N3_9EURO|nr:hypothetical protein BO94DRAFT_503721 [Aspergillus sclerotioniger CBS 115572]PWY67615.1 hypothetical protein BO94DRAFT_503721 [Aspergillus sclerotioniger CBS 115572]
MGQVRLFPNRPSVDKNKGHDAVSAILTQLETWAKERMDEEGNMDPCIDKFLVGVLKLDPSQRHRFSPDLEAVKAANASEMQRLAFNLKTSLDHQVPGYLDSALDVLDDPKLKPKFSQRWDAVGKQLDQLDPTGSFGGTMLETLIALPQQPSKGKKKKTTGASALTSAAFTEACQQLREAIENETSSASFTCGGIIPINRTEGHSASDNTSSAVGVYWKTQDKSTTHSLDLPVTDNLTGPVGSLIADCQPASFGRGGEDILDPEYRRAGKLDPGYFATTFHPADFGIVDIVERTLLPDISSMRSRKLRVELYKLNVYSGPSGHFRKHVDTPRSEHQIGSLVVCLPCEFEGGNLVVRHNGQETNFDWSPQSGSTIQWAAFYSDCEHEIETITRGDRITLTYNLYVRDVTEMTERVEAEIGLSSTIQPRSLSLYGLVESLLGTPGFMKEGGVLGIFCSHAYPHASDKTGLQLPQAFKGADLVVYAVLKSLGFKVSVVPILELNGSFGPGNDALGITGQIKDAKLRYEHSYSPRPSSGKLTWMLTTQPILEGMDIFRNKHDLPTPPARFNKAEGTRVGPEFRKYFTTETGGWEEEDIDVIGAEVWPSYYLPGITWITEPKHEEMAFTHMTYGNEAGLGTRYSCAAILAVIPPFSVRSQPSE